jgi:cysteine synthase B
MDVLLKDQTQLALPPSPALDSLVGNTPLLPLQRLGKDLPPTVSLYAKAEWFNPGGSVKDRPAWNIIRQGIQAGWLTPGSGRGSPGRPGRRLLDSTSGNMGISYATLAAPLCIPVTLAIPANASPERITILRTLGAELILTDPLEGSDGAIRVARELEAQYPHRYYYANQYDNPANWTAHFRTTGPEIVEQTRGQVTHFICGLGTSGTFTGTGRFLRSYNTEIRLISFEPDSPFHGLEGLKHYSSSIAPQIYDASIADGSLVVSTESAYTMVRRLAREEGLFVGVSSGAAAAAALQIASQLDAGVVVTVFPDAGYKYLSESFWQEPA